MSRKKQHSSNERAQAIVDLLMNDAGACDLMYKLMHQSFPEKSFNIDNTIMYQFLPVLAIERARAFARQRVLSTRISFR